MSSCRAGGRTTISGIGQRSRSLLRRRRELTYLDQALSSGTNLIASALAAGLLTASDFGAFAIAASVMIIVLGVLRSMSGSLLLVYVPVAADPAEVRRRTDGAISVSALGGLLSCAALVALGWGLGGQPGRALVVLGCVAPFVVVQDAARLAALAARRPNIACLSDGSWLLVSIACLMALRIEDHDSLELAIVAAYLPAAVGLIVPGIWRFDLAWTAASSWVRKHALDCAQLVGDFLLALSYGAVPLVLLSAVNADLELAGSVRAAQAVLGPLMVLYAASSLYLQPVIAANRQNLHLVRSMAMKQSALNTVLGIAWVGIGLAVPDRLGSRVFGLSWSGAQDVMLYLGLGFIGIGLSTGPLTALRAMGHFRTNLVTQAMVATLVWVSIVVLGVLAARGTLLGFGVGNIAAAVVPYAVLNRVLGHPSAGRHQRKAAPPRPTTLTRAAQSEENEVTPW